MELKRIGLGLTLLAVAASSACGTAQSQAASGAPRFPAGKGGDDRNGPYDVVPGWWKPAPDHDENWTWGSASGVWPDTPDRIFVPPLAPEDALPHVENATMLQHPADI